MRILLIGAGMMGRAIAYDLAQHEDVKEILIADRDRGKAEELTGWLADRRAIPQRLDVSAPRAVREIMDGCAAAISAVPYFFNLSLAEAAVECGAHFCDLGGNNRIVAAEFALDAKAKQADVTLIPDCGLAPGLVNILAVGAIDGLESVESVEIRVGGLPQHPQPPLDYQIVFSPHGLLNEYMEPATILRNGTAAEVPSLTGWEEIAFPPPYDRLEAFHTSGGSSTLPQTLLGQVNDLNYKTIRYRGHLEKIKAMANLGFFDESPLAIDDTEVVPRALAVRLFEKRLAFDGPDVILLRVTARGKKEGADCVVCYEMVDHHDERTGLSAMMRTTGFPIAQIAFMLASDRITKRGALPQESCIPAQAFIEGLQERGLAIQRSLTTE